MTELGSPLKIALLGCEHCHLRGNIRLMQELTGVEATVVWGLDTLRAAETARTLGARHISDLDQMENIDLAIITSDTLQHLPILQAIQGRARAIHLDKPLGVSGDEARKIAELAAPYGDLSGVGFFARVNPLIHDLIDRVHKDEIGRVQHLSITFGHAALLEGWSDDWPAILDQKRMGYGFFGDLAANAVDVAHLLVGELDARTCLLQTSVDGQSDIGGVATAVAADGALVRITTSATLRGPRMEIRVDGEDGSLWFRGRELGRYTAEGEEETLKRGKWSEASDSPRALINRLLGEGGPRPASIEAGVRVNDVLDRFYAIAVR